MGLCFYVFMSLVKLHCSSTWGIHYQDVQLITFPPYLQGANGFRVILESMTPDSTPTGGTKMGADLIIFEIFVNYAVVRTVRWFNMRFNHCHSGIGSSDGRGIQSLGGRVIPIIHFFAGYHGLRVVVTKSPSRVYMLVCLVMAPFRRLC